MSALARHSRFKVWSIPRAWDGERAWIIGGGKSIQREWLPKLTGNIIAVNAAFHDRPDASAVLWTDDRFFRKEHQTLRRFTGWHITTRAEHASPHYEIKHLHRAPMTNGIRGLSQDPTALGGMCSGGSAINLAYLLGCKEIVLLGFDMGGPHYHRYYSIQSQQSHYKDMFMPHIEAMAPALKKAGVDVLNCSPLSKLKCFKRVRFEGVL